MKSFDIDAKLLIKKYIDSIEEYLREHTQIHPNEIDSLLNEINDFIYIRTEEISIDPENRIRYADVLKAIDECGSPSEICDLYLDQNHNVTKKHFISKLEVTSPSNLSIKEDNKARDSVKIKRDINSVDTEIKSKTVKEQIKFYTKSPLFSFYRFFFLLFISYLFLLVISTNPIRYINDYIWWMLVHHDASLDIEFLEAYQSTLEICSIMTVYFIILVSWESFIINGWKKHLSKINNMNHELDNKMIVFLSRFGFLIILFKASVLLSLIYVIFIPLWVLLLLLSERQMSSKLWIEKLAPFITGIGLRLVSRRNTSIKTIKKPDQSLFKRKKPISELIFVSALILILGLTFLYPEISKYYIGDHPHSIINGYRFHIHLYFIDDIILYALVCVILSLIYIIVFKFFHHFKKDEELISYDFTILNWLVRLLTLKIVILFISYTIPIDSMPQGATYFTKGYYSTFFLIIGWFIIEIITSPNKIVTYGAKYTRLNLGKALIKVGGSQTIYIGSDKDSLIETTHFNFNAEKENYQKDTKSSATFFSIEKWLLVAYKILSSIFMTISLFTVLLFEIILIIISIYTPFTSKGEIVAAFIFIGVHILAVIILDTYRLVLNKPSGLTIKMGRMIAFMLLGWILVVNILIYINPSIIFITDPYYDGPAETFKEEFFRMEFLYRFILIIIIPVFSEIAIWRNKQERIKLGI